MLQTSPVVSYYRVDNIPVSHFYFMPDSQNTILSRYEWWHPHKSTTYHLYNVGPTLYKCFVFAGMLYERNEVQFRAPVWQKIVLTTILPCKAKRQYLLTAWIHCSTKPKRSDWILLYVAFCTIMTEESPKSGLHVCPTLISNDFTRLFEVHNTYHRQHCTVQAFEQFGAYVYAQPRWQISGTTVIRTWYLQSIQMSHRGRPKNAVAAYMYIYIKWAFAMQ